MGDAVEEGEEGWGAPEEVECPDADRFDEDEDEDGNLNIFAHLAEVDPEGAFGEFVALMAQVRA